MKGGHANQSAVACLDPAVGLSALFRPLGNVRRRPSLDVSYDLGGGRALRFSAREALGGARADHAAGRPLPRPKVSQDRCRVHGSRPTIELGAELVAASGAGRSRRHR